MQLGRIGATELELKLLNTPAVSEYSTLHLHFYKSLLLLPSYIQDPLREPFNYYLADFFR